MKMPIFAYISANRIGHQAWETMIHCSYAKDKNRHIIIIYSPKTVNLEFRYLKTKGVSYICLPQSKIFRQILINVLKIIRSPQCSDTEMPLSDQNQIKMRYPRFGNDFQGRLFDLILKPLPSLRSSPFIHYDKDYWNFSLLIKKSKASQLSNSVKRNGEKLIKSLNLDKVSWFICLHTRESSFLGDKFREWQNQKIENYNLAIDEIVKMGGAVVRMGDPSMTPIKNRLNVIDYAHSEYRSSFADLFLISKCLFFIGCQSGLRTLPQLFRKPILTVNAYPISPLDFYPEHLIIFKKVLNIQSMKYLNFEEIMSDPLYCFHDTDKDYTKAGIKIVENDPEEILEAMREIFKLIRDGFPSYTIEQKKSEFFIQDKLAHNDKINNKTNFYPSALCRIGQAYLKQFNLMGGIA